MNDEIDFTGVHAGYNLHRLDASSYSEKEEAFLLQWQEEQKRNPSRPLLGWILGSGDFRPYTLQESRAAASIIQWLGTPVGQSFLRRVNARLEEECENS